MSEEQAVINEDTSQAKPEDKSVDAQDTRSELDKILDEIPAETETTQTAQTQTQTGEPDLKQTVEQLQQQVASLTSGNDLKDLASQVRGDLDADTFDDDMVISWLDSQARKDPRIQQVWMNRDKNPGAFKQATAALGKKFQGMLSKVPNQQVTDDLNAVEAAARSASTKTVQVEEVNWAEKSDAELDEWKRQHGGRSAFYN